MTQRPYKAEQAPPRRPARFSPVRRAARESEPAFRDAFSLAPYSIDCHVIDALMPELVGGDRRPSAFLVYLAIAADARGFSTTYEALAGKTGLSKRAVQEAVALLKNRNLIEARRWGRTGAAVYRALAPWRR